MTTKISLSNCQPTATACKARLDGALSNLAWGEVSLPKQGD